jgi:group II intron reverse transcriptase/maturase
VNWFLVADIRSFFDTLQHEWLVRFVEHRVADKRVVRLIQKWLRAGVMEDGVRSASQVGTVQGGSISPLLANLYLHYVFDLWLQRWRERASGDVVVVRFADDFVVGFERQDEAERFQGEPKERLARFGLELHPDKTRLIEFGRHAAREREQRGDGKPQTFDFLGFTHACGRTRAGRFKVTRQTARKRLQAKLRAVAATLRIRWHWPVPKLGAWLGSVVRGHVRYFGVPDNGRAIGSFRHWVGWHWGRAMRRRSQADRTLWAKMSKLVSRWLPPAKTCHPWPHQRLAAITQGRSRMR